MSARSRFGRHSWWWPPVAAYMAAIFYVSSLPNPAPELIETAGDKTLHLIAYAGLAFLCGRGFSDEGVGRRLTLLFAFVVAGLYGATDEWHQSFVPGRGPDVYDWVADAAGAAIGAVIHAAIAPVAKLRSLSTPAQT